MEQVARRFGTDRAPDADSPYRVMVVDDSAVIRGLLSRALEADPRIEIVCKADNGSVALQQLKKYDVDVIVLDIEMPVMDGLTALPQIKKIAPDVQVIMASTLTLRNADISMRALRAGAADYIPKPTSATQISGGDAFKRELTEKVCGLGAVARRKGAGAGSAGSPAASRNRPAPAARAIQLRKPSTRRPSVVAIGSSTGGPQALMSVFAKITQSVKQPILVTQHMPPTFTTILADHIARTSGRPTAEAEDGTPVKDGHVYVAPGNRHMVVERKAAGLVTRLNDDPPVNFCRPAVDPLFFSISEACAETCLAVVLTGMGRDGADGAKAIADKGGTVIAQDEATSVVWGMPGATAEIGACSAVLPLNDIAPQIERIASGGAR